MQNHHDTIISLDIFIIYSTRAIRRHNLQMIFQENTMETMRKWNAYMRVKMYRVTKKVISDKLDVVESFRIICRVSETF